MCKQKKTGHIRSLSLIVAAALCLTYLCGCGINNRRKDVISTVDSFLSAAQNADLSGAGTYATEEVMTQLEWNDAAFEGVKNNFYESIGGYGEINVDDLKAIPEISGAVDGFIEKLKSVMVSSYTINEDSYATEGKVYEITANVKTVSEDDIRNLMSGDIVNKVTAFATKYMTEHASELSKTSEAEVYINLYKELIPYTMEELAKDIDKIAGSKEELWGFTLEDRDGKLIITGVYDASGKSSK